MAQPEEHVDIWIEQLIKTGSLNERKNMFFVVEDHNGERTTLACDSKLFETIVYALSKALSDKYRFSPKSPIGEEEAIHTLVWDVEEVLSGYRPDNDRTVLMFETEQKVPVYVALGEAHLKQLQSSLRKAARTKQKMKNRKPH